TGAARGACAGRRIRRGARRRRMAMLEAGIRILRIRDQKDIVNTPNPKVIVALDFPEPVAALALADRLDPKECALKVGKELFVSGGPEPVRRMVDGGFKVLCVLKFNEIYNYVWDE